MCPFVVGQEVVYAPPVTYRKDGYGDEQLPHRGHIYTIRAIEPDALGEICLLLIEVRNTVRRYAMYDALGVVIARADVEPSWRWTDFRPLNKREEDLKETLRLKAGLSAILQELASWVAK